MKILAVLVWSILALLLFGLFGSILGPIWREHQRNARLHRAQKEGWASRLDQEEYEQRREREQAQARIVKGQ